MRINDSETTPTRSRLGLTSWLWIIAAATTIAAVIIAASLIPMRYVVQSPGPTVDVLATQGDIPVLDFTQSGDDPYELVIEDEADGQLRMVTVNSIGGPGSTVRVKDIVAAWFQTGTAIIPYDDLYSPQVTAEDVAEAGKAQMQSSHSAATIAALDYLGLPMTTTMTVIDTVEGGGSDGILLPGDVLVSIETPDGQVHEVTKPSVPYALMEETDPQSAVQVVVDREGERKTVQVITSAPEEQSPTPSRGSKMGVYLSADTDTPVDVAIHLERIGGPSAGLIFALGIIDRLTPGGIIGDDIIAGTGALDFAGNVLPIGGVVQKMYGAQRDGAHWFLLPTENCLEAAGKEPAGITAVPVSNLREGVGVVEKIAADDTGDLPQCPVKVDAAG